MHLKEADFGIRVVAAQHGTGNLLFIREPCTNGVGNRGQVETMQTNFRENTKLTYIQRKEERVGEGSKEMRMRLDERREIWRCWEMESEEARTRLSWPIKIAPYRDNNWSAVPCTPRTIVRSSNSGT